jgi:hypothetical protein
VSVEMYEVLTGEGIWKILLGTIIVSLLSFIINRILYESSSTIKPQTEKDVPKDLEIRYVLAVLMESFILAFTLVMINAIYPMKPLMMGTMLTIIFFPNRIVVRLFKGIEPIFPNTPLELAKEILATIVLVSSVIVIL